MDQDADDDVNAVQAEVDSLRERTQEVAETLHRRLHHSREQVTHVVDEARQLVDVRGQLRRHPQAARVLLAATLAGAGVAVLTVLVQQRRQRRRRNALARLRMWARRRW